MSKIKWNVAFVILTFLACVGVICYAAVQIDEVVTVDNIMEENDYVIVIDAGHGGMHKVQSLKLNYTTKRLKCSC